ncbi:MAG: hypothetical protein ACKPHU_37225, partial [Planctomycetaceae bacterium]
SPPTPLARFTGARGGLACGTNSNGGDSRGKLNTCVNENPSRIRAGPGIATDLSFGGEKAAR